MMGAGVSRALATVRRARVTDVRYALSLDVTQRDTARGVVEVAFTRVAVGDAILDFRGLGIDSLRVNGRAVPVTRAVWNGAHVAIDGALLTAGTNRVTLRFRAPIAAAGEPGENPALRQLLKTEHP